MAKWLIRTFTSATGAKPVEDWIHSLDAEARAAVRLAVLALRQSGVELGMPFARYLDDEIWELRVRDRDGIYRVLYFHWKGRTFGLLHGFSKQTQKTPVRELTLAKQRRALWLGRGRPTKGRTRDG